ncbi:hypothetical protein C0993_011898, partial [Termitomyces sp. T159_Od127]
GLFGGSPRSGGSSAFYETPETKKKNRGREWETRTERNVRDVERDMRAVGGSDVDAKRKLKKARSGRSASVPPGGLFAGTEIEKRHLAAVAPRPSVKKPPPAEEAYTISVVGSSDRRTVRRASVASRGRVEREQEGVAQGRALERDSSTRSAPGASSARVAVPRAPRRVGEVERERASEGRALESAPGASSARVVVPRAPRRVGEMEMVQVKAPASVLFRPEVPKTPSRPAVSPLRSALRNSSRTPSPMPAAHRGLVGVALSDGASSDSGDDVFFEAEEGDEWVESAAPRRRKSVRVSLKPTFAGDVWEDSSDEDAEYARARTLLSRQTRA